jgi:fructose-specific phosphotransferase system IIC component
LWVSDTFRYSLFGLMGGCLLGLLGLALTQWERTPQALYYTPNRWLILIITLAVTARLLYGVWRILHGWRTSGSDMSWLATAGIAGSLALGAIMLGYYVTYSAGVRWRLRRRDKT